MKVWLCPDVPNLTVKSETTVEGASAAKSSTSVTKIDLK